MLNFVGIWLLVGFGAIASLPDPTLTPGDIGDTDPAIICVPGYSKAHRIYQNQGRAAYEELISSVLASYGHSVGEKNNFEFDDRVPVGVGGRQSALNIWPQQCSAWRYEAHGGRQCIGGEAFEKDKCEFKVYRLVCRTHQMSPVDAQTIFMGDWRSYCFGG